MQQMQKASGSGIYYLAAGQSKKNEGLCMVCAKELNIPQISEYMKHMGITDEEPGTAV